MRARVPQDVDLEDKVIYGLTPVRFGYLVIAVLGAMTCSGMETVPVGVRAGGCAALLVGGVSLAWGRWRGLPLDRLLLDIARFAWRNRRPQPSRRTRAGRAVGPIDLSHLRSLGRLPTGGEEQPP